MTKRSAGSRAAVAAMTLLAVSACSTTSDDAEKSDPDEVAWEFTTRPDLTPPRVSTTTTDAGRDAATEERAENELVFLGIKEQDKGAPMNGPVILDSDGDPVWVHPMGDTRWTYDLRVQRYQGQPVLTWWRGDTHPFGYGEGEFVVMDQTYREIATITSPGTHADFHDVTLTKRGTALLISFPEVARDLSHLGGPTNGYVRDSVVHEIDIATGKELFRWSALEHIPLAESQSPLDPDEEESGTKEAPYDPYHVNSVTEDGKGKLLVSARNTHAIYKVAQRTGRIAWTLGGEDSDFQLSDNATFAWQHDAERQADRTITLFDNQAAPAVGEESRGLRLKLDHEAKTAEVVATYLPPDGRLSESQGNLEVLRNGSVFIGWGSQPFYSHYSADGELLQDTEIAGGISYRAHRDHWVGHPTEPPAFALVDGEAYVSWNGATKVEEWRFVAGPDEKTAEPIATVPADGFETSMRMPDAAYIGAQALDESGKVLATATPGAWP